MKSAIYILCLSLSTFIIACSEGSFVSNGSKSPASDGSSGGGGDNGIDGGDGADTAGGINSGDLNQGGGSGNNVIGFGSDNDSNATIVIDGKITNESGLKPVLALNSASCIACHAKIKGDLITDFNVTENPFLSRTSPNDLIRSDSIRHDAYSSMNLDGNLVIPKITISGGIFADRLKSTTKTLKEALTTYISYSGISNYPGFPSGKALKVISETRNKAAAGINKLTEVNTVSISPPTTAEIMGLANTPGIKTLIPSSGTVAAYGLTGTSKLEGFTFVSGASGELILKNVAASAVCEGDILVTGSVVLSRLSDLQVGDGCRLYVAKSLFITGVLTLTGSEKRNLQIAAGQEVLMGIKSARFIGSTRAGTIIGHDDLVNARPFLEDTSSSHNYERILITASRVDSRYYGKYKGIIISNMALFVLTRFNFEADSVFESVPILPRLGKRVLSVK